MMQSNSDSVLNALSDAFLWRIVSKSIAAFSVSLNARTYHAIHRRPRNLNVVVSIWVGRTENGLGIVVESDNTKFRTVVVGEVLVQRIGRIMAFVLRILYLGELQLGHRPGIESRGQMSHISAEVAHGGKRQRTNVVVLFSDLMVRPA